MGWLDYFLSSEDIHLALAQIQGGLAGSSVSGQTFWVDSSDPSATSIKGAGTYQKPYDTIASAMNNITADRGDVILCKPKHAESWTSAQTYSLHAGVSIRGLGWGTQRPAITLTSSGGLALDSMNMSIINFRFVCGAAAIPIVIELTQDGASAINCDFLASDATYYPEIGIYFNTNGERATVDGCRFLFDNWATTTGREAAIKLKTCQYGASIRNCHFHGQWLGDNGGTQEGAAIFVDAGDGPTVQDLVIENNTFYILGAKKYGCIYLEDGATAIVRHNNGYHNYTTALNPTYGINAPAWFNNYWTNDLTKSGQLYPAA